VFNTRLIGLKVNLGIVAIRANPTTTFGSKAIKLHTPLDPSQHGVVHVTKDNNTHGQPNTCHALTSTIGVEPKKVHTTTINLIQHGLGDATNNSTTSIGARTMEMHNLKT